MKVKVIKTFRDKNTKSILRPGQIIEVTEERFGELTEPFVFVEKIEEELQIGAKESEKTQTNDGKFNSVALNKMKKEDIVMYAKEVMTIDLNMEMTKEEMIEMLSR